MPVAISGDGRLIAAGGAHPRIVNLETQTSIALPAPEAVGGTMQFSPDDSLLLVRCGPNLHVMDTATGILRRTIRVPIDTETVACSPDGKTLATGAHHVVTLWHTDTGQKVATVLVPGDRRGVHTVQFSADGQQLAAITWSFHPNHPDADTAALYIW